MKRLSLAACALAALLAAPRAAEANNAAPRLALTRYFYGYQADPRKPLPAGQPVRGADGASLFAVNPMEGLGPWFGYGHAMWHRENLTNMRRAGFDVALPVFRADTASLNGYAVHGLDSLSAALIELKREKRDYPLIGMFYDTTSPGAPDSPLQVDTEAGREAFYAGIRAFFRHVPEEFRALVRTETGYAAILTVGSPAGLSGLDASLRPWVDARFRADFGRALVWVGDSEWKRRAGNLDGYASFNDGRALALNSDGGISTAVIGPGYNNTGLGTEKPEIRSRRAGHTMIDGWRDLFKQTADWIVVETWNDFAHGSAVAPSRAYGVREMDSTMAGLLQFRAVTGLVTQALRVNAPEVVAARSVTQIEAVVQNGSLQQWGRGNISYSASWYQNGQRVAEGARVPVMQAVPMMGLLNLNAALVSAKTDGTPLAEGDYEVRLEFFQTGTTEDGKLAYLPFHEPAAVFPVRVGTPAAPAARLLTSDTPPYLMAGATTTASVVLRNDGPAAWPKGKTRLAWRLVPAEEPDATPLASGQGAPLEADVAPGAATTPLELSLAVPKEAGSDAPAGEPLLLMWNVVIGPERLTVEEAPGAPARRAVRVQPLVRIAHFPIGNSAPSVWSAGTEQEIRTVVRNVGPTVWKPTNIKVGYHWFYWDGTEALWDSEKTSLPREVKPGEEWMVRLNVTAPQRAGAYVLAVDLWDGDRWISTLPATAGFDMSLSYVNVTGGDLRPVELTGLFDLDGIIGEFDPDETDAAPADGDFADGFAYPADQMPPDVPSPLQLANAPRGPYPPSMTPVLYPAGYFGPLDTVGSQSLRRIPFRYPDKHAGDRNFIVARGQNLPVGVGAYNHIYLLGAATAPVTGVFRLNYADATRQDVEVPVSAWNALPTHNEPVGLMTTFRQSTKGEDAAHRAYLFVYEIPVDPARVLHSITFPENRAIRVVAITADHKPTFALPTITP